MDQVIGVDIGTQSTKAVLCDAHGKILAQHSSAYQVDTPQPFWAEQWPSVWLDAVSTTVARCVKDAAATPQAGTVRAICISSLYGGSGIPVDSEMQPLHPCLIWMDRRATAEVAWVRENLDVDTLVEETGNGIDSYYGFTKMLWLKRNRPDVWKRTRYLVPPNAWVIHALTGELAVDHSSAGNIGGVYDLAGRRWSEKMLQALGIPLAMMPERLVHSHEVVGHLLPQWSRKLGLPADTPVMAGGVDAAVATFAAGATQPGNHVAMIGTSMCWGTLHHTHAGRQGLISMPHVFRGERDNYVFGGAITAGASVSWFRDQFCNTEAEMAKAGGQRVDAILDDAASSLPVGSAGLLFLPYLMGERSPVWDDRARGCFAGLTLFHTRAHLYRAVLEGVAFALRDNIEAASGAVGQLDERLIVVGGAASSDLWVRIIAEVTGFPVFTITQNVEAALGAALLAALGLGLVTQEQAARGWVTLVERAKPESTAHATYGRMFDLYKKIYVALKPVLHELALQ